MTPGGDRKNGFILVRKVAAQLRIMTYIASILFYIELRFN